MPSEMNTWSTRDSVTEQKQGRIGAETTEDRNRSERERAEVLTAMPGNRAVSKLGLSN